MPLESRDTNMKRPQNLRAIKANFLSPTNNRGARIAITCQHWPHKNERKIINYDYEHCGAADNAQAYLEALGFNIIAQTTISRKGYGIGEVETDYTIFLTDDFSRSIKDGKPVCPELESNK